MTSDHEKDPPVPADLEGAAQRIRHKQDPEESETTDHEAAAVEPND